jgi:hypothetical protein
MFKDRYRINSPTIAMFLEDGRHVAHMVPEGSIIILDSDSLNEDKLINGSPVGPKSES